MRRLATLVRERRERIRRALQWIIPVAAYVGVGASAYANNHFLYAHMLLATIMLAAAVGLCGIWIALAWVYGVEPWPHRWRLRRLVKRTGDAEGVRT